MSKKDIDFLLYNKIFYSRVDRDQALKYQRVVKGCYAYGIHSGRMWDTKWRTIEKKEETKKKKREQKIEDR
ncbi:hypothetical protein Hanom_Chr16g01462851 [Helianthus anomalus]